ncbi:hypothetical protein HYH03_010707 [Edaphochlamys debaryana]|uniref:Ribosomal RNA methyltransferase FtsJ domain-containing protein n=1 Tax=Edaphochlamys debaryana TaxID=47281 RepID=A0A835XVX0_9CHLO|nr:hypothetical protein HYH03_010707 [Edaphochlamys debaryana]|eukprot:KAG2490785.1 hypothetical protein HYH03_010707 [Edaphochlamys debaryana]
MTMDERGGSAAASRGWHVLFQFPNQLHVYRLKQLFDSGNSHVFPEGFANEAVELGPIHGQLGPCLLMFTWVGLGPEQLLDWLKRSCYDWVVLRIYWISASPVRQPASAPASATADGAAQASGAVQAQAAQLPYATYTGPRALLEAVRAAAQAAGGPEGLGGVKLQVYPRSVEAATAVLLSDALPLELDGPSHVLFVIQWPSEPVAAATAAVAACEADHVRLAKTHDKQQKASQHMAEELEGLAAALRAAGQVPLSEAEMAAAEAAAAAGEGKEAAGGAAEAAEEEEAVETQEAACAQGGDEAAAAAEEAACGQGEGEGGEANGDGAQRKVAKKVHQNQRMKKQKKVPSGDGPVPVLEAVAAIADPTERWRVATARAGLERRRQAEREQRRAAVVERCAAERAALDAALAAAQEVAQYSYGLAPADWQYQYGSDRDKKMPGQLCRAASKLREALICCTGSAELRPGLAAVDVGAAPGGWTQMLAAAGARLVVSIDPAQMDPGVAALPNVTHLQCRCDEAVASGRLAGALEAAGLSEVDYVVCDVNAHPGQTVGWLEPVLPLLAPGGSLILTLKTFGRGKDKESYGAELAERLGPGFEPGRLVWLLSNTLCERTYVAVKRAAVGV